MVNLHVCPQNDNGMRTVKFVYILIIHSATMEKWWRNTNGVAGGRQAHQHEKLQRVWDGWVGEG